MGSEIIAALTGLVCSCISSVVTFIITKRKYNTEVDSQQIQNTNDAFDLYKKAMTETLEVKDRKIEMLQREVDSLREQVDYLQKQVLALIKKVDFKEPEENN